MKIELSEHQLFAIERAIETAVRSKYARTHPSVTAFDLRHIIQAIVENESVAFVGVDKGTDK